MIPCLRLFMSSFFFNDTATTEIYTLSLHDALPISRPLPMLRGVTSSPHTLTEAKTRSEEHTSELQSPCNLVCRLLLEKKKNTVNHAPVREPRARRHRAALASRYVARRLYPLSAVYRQAIIIVFFFNDTATTEIYTLSLHDALPI